jgi:uncharacterized membrane protein
MNNTYEESISDFLTDMSPNVGRTERIVSAAAGGALIAFGIKRGGVTGTIMSVLGGAMLFRGATGHCHMYDAAGINTMRDVPMGTQRSPYNKRILSGQIHVKKGITIDRPANVVYEFWKNFENFPKFMQHVEVVTKNADNTWHWKVKAPLGTSVEWDAQVTSDVENEKIGWRSIENSDIPNSGVVEFRGTPTDSTELTVTLIYEAPAGKFCAWAAWALGEEPGLQVSYDLRRFKEIVESEQKADEIARTTTT